MIEIRLVSPVNEVLRPDDAVVVEAGEALVEITGLADGVPIRADGVAVSPIELGGGRVLLHFDLRRSTGFHYIDVPPHRRVWFGSADDALNLEGVRQLVDDLGENALYWHGQLLFSDGTVGRSARADYGWLDGWADATLAAVAATCEQPRWSRRTASRVVRPAAGRLDLRRTSALLRARGRALLSEASEGPVSFAGQSYEPAKVVVRERVRTLSSVEHRRAAFVVSAIREMCRSVSMRASAPPDARTRLARWRATAEELEGHPVLVRGRAFARDPRGVPRTTMERVDGRATAIFEAFAILTTTLGWAPNLLLAPHYAFLKFADEVFQEWAAVRFAAALDAIESPPGSSARFRSSQLDIYVNQVPPPGVLRSWRLDSIAPTAQRPDIVVHDRATGRVMLVDAKYRTTAGSLDESARREVMSYMNSYGVSHCVAVYPARSAAIALRPVAAHGQVISELGLAPDIPELGEKLRNTIPELFTELAEHPAFVTPSA